MFFNCSEARSQKNKQFSSCTCTRISNKTCFIGPNPRCRFQEICWIDANHPVWRTIEVIHVAITASIVHIYPFRYRKFKLSLTHLMAILVLNMQRTLMICKNSKWVWSGNTTITNCRQTHGTARKSHNPLFCYAKCAVYNQQVPYLE